MCSAAFSLSPRVFVVRPSPSRRRRRSAAVVFGGWCWSSSSSTCCVCEQHASTCAVAAATVSCVQVFYTAVCLSWSTRVYTTATASQYSGVFSFSVRAHMLRVRYACGFPFVVGNSSETRAMDTKKPHLTVAVKQSSRARITTTTTTTLVRRAHLRVCTVRQFGRPQQRSDASDQWPSRLLLLAAAAAHLDNISGRQRCYKWLWMFERSVQKSRCHHQHCRCRCRLLLVFVCTRRRV